MSDSKAKLGSLPSLSYDDFNMTLAVAFLQGMRDHDLSPWSDVTVEVQGELFQCHRNFLSICSGFFRAMFNSGMKEAQEKSVHLEDISNETFSVILRCLKENKSLLNSSNFIEIWKATDMLEILALKDEAESFAKSNICVSNCFTIYHTAKSMQEKNMVDFSWDFILSNFDDIVVSARSDVLDLPFNEFKSLISEDKLKTKSENAVIKLIIDYAHNLLNGDNVTNDGETDAKMDHGHISEKNQIEEKLYELLMCSRLILASDNYLMTLLLKNKTIQEMPKIRSLIGECIQWKSETGLDCISNISSILSCERVHSKFENVLVHTGNNSLRKETILFFKSFKRTFKDVWSYSFADINDVVVNAVICNNQLFVMSQKGDLYINSLDENFTFRLLKTGVAQQNETENIGLAVVGHNLYVVGTNTEDLHIGACHVQFLPLENLLTPVKNMKLVVFGTSIVIFGSANDDMKTTIVQCIDLHNNNHYRLDDVEGPPNQLMTFQTRKDTFFLFGTGALWKLEQMDDESGRFQAKFITMLWDFSLTLQGAVIICDKLWIFSKSDGHKLHDKIWHLSVEGAFTSIHNVQLITNESSSTRGWSNFSHFMTVRMTRSACDKICKKKEK